MIKNSDLHNFADNKTISSVVNNIEELLKTLEKPSEGAIGWFRQNSMIFNPGKFQSIIPNNKYSVYSSFN